MRSAAERFDLIKAKARARLAGELPVRIRTSLQHVHGDTRDNDDDLQSKAAAVFQQRRGVYFSAAQLARLHWASRALIVREGEKLYGRRLPAIGGLDEPEEERQA